MNMPSIDINRLEKVGTQQVEYKINGLSGERTRQPAYTSPFFYQNNEWEQYKLNPYLFKRSMPLSLAVGNNYYRLKLAFQKNEFNSLIDVESIKSIFNRVAVSLSELPFEKCAVELTSSHSIKFSLAFLNDTLLIISKPLDNVADVSQKDVIFSMFKDRKMIASNVSNTSELVAGFKKFLSL